ncbi:MAG: glycosyltransferase family 2 protein [Pyrinomonadaceae bacterium]
MEEIRIGESVKSSPKVSVITPLFKAANHIGESLESLFSQTFQDFEAVLVNDGSPDSEELEEALKPFADRIIYIKQPNQGASVARNTAIRNANGEILAFLDHDDIWFPEYLESQLRAREEKNCDMIYCNAKLFGTNSLPGKTYMAKAPSNGVVNSVSLLEGKCNPITSGTMVSRKAVVDVGMFDETLPRIGFEDFDLWFRLARAGTKIDYQQKILIKYRVHHDSLSGEPMKIAERDLVVAEHSRKVYKLTPDEERAYFKRFEEANAFLNLLKAKEKLSSNEFVESVELFKNAQRYYKSNKLRIMIPMLMLNPAFSLRLLKLLRPGEYNIVVSNGNKTDKDTQS